MYASSHRISNSFVDCMHCVEVVGVQFAIETEDMMMEIDNKLGSESDESSGDELEDNGKGKSDDEDEFSDKEDDTGPEDGEEKDKLEDSYDDL